MSCTVDTTGCNPQLSQLCTLHKQKMLVHVGASLLLGSQKHLCQRFPHWLPRLSMYEPQRWYLGYSCPSNGKQIIILLGMMKFSTPGIPLYPQESPSLADVRTGEMSKEMREEWMQNAQNQQLGSSGIGQSSAYCLIDLMSNYMGGCVKIGHPLNFTGLIKIVSYFDWNFGVYTLVWTHRHTHVVVLLRKIWDPWDPPQRNTWSFFKETNGSNGMTQWFGHGACQDVVLNMDTELNTIKLAVLAMRLQTRTLWTIWDESFCFNLFLQLQMGRLCSALPVNAVCGVFSLHALVMSSDPEIPLPPCLRQKMKLNEYLTDKEQDGWSAKERSGEDGEPVFLPSGELTFCHGKSPCFMGKSTISMAIFHGKMLVHQRAYPVCVQKIWDRPAAASAKV